jgi:competence protein ComEC
MFEKRLYFSATVQQGKKQHPPILMGQAESIQIWIDQARDAIRQRVNTSLAESSARHVISALLVGDQRAIASEDWTVFSRTGVAHLMSISGLHVTMFAGLAGWIAAALWRLACVWPIAAALWIPVQSVRAFAASTGAIGYALLAGFAVPAQRTALMVTVVSAAVMFGIRAHPWAVLCVALLLVILTDPIAVLAPGFWLSFMAVGFLFALPREQEGTERSIGARLVSALKSASHAQLVITFGLLPITVLFFQQIVLVGPLANAVAIPVVSFLVTPASMLGLVEQVMIGSNLLLQLAAWTQDLVQVFLRWCAGLSLATVDWPTPGVVRTVIASVGMLIALGHVLPRRFSSARHIGWLGLIALIGVGIERPALGEMDVTFIDVGQGSSVLIRTHQHNMLVDAGPAFGDADAGQRMVLPTLRRIGVRHLDRVMISHGDQDHDGGYPSVAAYMPIGMTQSPIANEPSGAQACRAGDQWQWDGVSFFVLHPTTVDEKDTNASSCVLKVQTSSGSTLLLAGDIPQRIELALVDVASASVRATDSPTLKAKPLVAKSGRKQTSSQLGASAGAALPKNGAQGPSLSAQVLLAPHHGSKTSSSAEFLNAVNPQLVVIQAGYRNRFGHPHAEVMGRVMDRPGTRVARTDLGGALTIRWHQQKPVVEDFWGQYRRYWHIPRRPW